MGHSPRRGPSKSLAAHDYFLGQAGPMTATTTSPKTKNVSPKVNSHAHEMIEERSNTHALKDYGKHAHRSRQFLFSPPIKILSHSFLHLLLQVNFKATKLSSSSKPNNNISTARPPKYDTPPTPDPLNPPITTPPPTRARTTSKELRATAP